MSGSLSVNRDQCQYLLNGGELKRNSGGSVKKCSLTSFYLQNLSPLEDGTNSDDRKSLHGTISRIVILQDTQNKTI